MTIIKKLRATESFLHSTVNKKIILVLFISSKVKAFSLCPCQRGWAWGNKVWGSKRSRSQEHLWHFILLWKCCHIALILPSRLWEDKNKCSQNQCNTALSGDLKKWKGVLLTCKLRLYVWIYDQYKYILKHIKTFKIVCFVALILDFVIKLFHSSNKSKTLKNKWESSWVSRKINLLFMPLTNKQTLFGAQFGSWK